MFLRFAPWVLFSVVTSQFDWRFGLVVGLVAQIVAIVVVRPRHIAMLDVAMVGFFTVGAVYAFAQPDAAIQDWVQAIATTWITVVSLASIVVGRPFTLAYSTGDVSPEIAASDLFHDINTRIAWAWTGAFAGMATAAFIATAVDAPWISTVATVVLVLRALRFTERYPDRAVAAALPQTAVPSVVS